MKELRRADPLLKKILQPQKLAPETGYVRSQYALSYVHGQERIWFHTLTRQAVVCDRPLPERITGAEIEADADLADLARGYFFVPAGKDEDTFYLGLFQILHAMIRKKGVKGYTILPTTACNARCIYCFEEERSAETMTPETVSRVIRYIRETRRPEEIEIQWFGGEPLAAVHVIDGICDGLNAEGKPYTGSMVTNGSLITEEIADRMKETWKIGNVQVSMDGNEEDYLLRKRYAGGVNPYRTVLRNIRLLADREIRVTVRCNVDEKNLPGIRAFLQDLTVAVPDKRYVDVRPVPLDQARAGKHAVEVWSETFATYSLIRSFGFPAKDPRQKLRDLRNHYCMADLGSVVIAPDGAVYACDCCTAESRVGCLADGPEDPAARERFCGTYRVADRCRGCPFLPECTACTFCPVRSRDARCREVQELLLRKRMEAFFEHQEPEVQETGSFGQEC